MLFLQFVSDTFDKNNIFKASASSFSVTVNRDNKSMLILQFVSAAKQGQHMNATPTIFQCY
jgi:hypothetical protein